MNPDAGGASAPAPHWHDTGGVSRTMIEVLAALVPGICIYVWFFGWGVVAQLLTASVCALLVEAAMCAWRGRRVMAELGDCSALVTAWLLALCLPPYAPWWVAATGVTFALVVAKHAYGGLGANVFNPAMAGYAVVLVSFPQQMIRWPSGPVDSGVVAAFRQVLGGGQTVDGVTSATLLDSIRTRLARGEQLDAITASDAFTTLGEAGWQWIAAAYALGGLWLLARGIIRWHIPVAMLLALALTATALHAFDSSRFASPWLHLFAGGSLLAAFFIATDPVTAATSPAGRLLFGAGIGVIACCIRVWGGYPDGIAFAVLLMNAAAPAIDQFTRPRTFGHGNDP